MVSDDQSRMRSCGFCTHARVVEGEVGKACLDSCRRFSFVSLSVFCAGIHRVYSFVEAAVLAETLPNDQVEQDDDHSNVISQRNRWGMRLSTDWRL